MAPASEKTSNALPVQVSRFLAFPVLAVGGQWYWMQQGPPDLLLSVLIWIPLLTYCWFCVGGLSHELVHQNLPLGPRASRIIGQVIGTTIGIPYTVYREVHMRHHAYLNTPLDFELWPYSDPRRSLRFRRIFVWFDMLAGSIVTPLIWSRICFSPNSPVSSTVRRQMRKEYLWCVIAGLLLLAVGGWLVFTGQNDVQPVSLIYLAPLLLAANCNSIRKLMEHVGTCSYDPVYGTRTVIGRSLVTRMLSYFDFDLAIHGPHHRYPKLNHSLLEGRMLQITESKAGPDVPLFHSFTAALIDTFRTAIKNPAVGLNAGCTEDLSHLPGLKSTDQPAEASGDGQHFAYTTPAGKTV